MQEVGFQGKELSSTPLFSKNIVFLMPFEIKKRFCFFFFFLADQVKFKNSNWVLTLEQKITKVLASYVIHKKWSSIKDALRILMQVLGIVLNPG